MTKKPGLLARLKAFHIKDTRNMAALMPRRGVNYINNDDEPKEPRVKDNPIDFDDADLAWRRLALQFDSHRMMALWHLKALLDDPAGHRETAKKFLSMPPLSGEQVLENRLKAIVVGIVQDDVVKLLDKL